MEILQDLAAAKPHARYVPLGRSGTPIDALLRTLAPDNTYGVPLSLRDVLGEPLEYPLRPVVRDRIYRQFDRFFPPAGASEIVLIDYFDTGETLFLAHEIARDYLKARGRKESVSVYGIGAYTEGFLRDAKAKGIPAAAKEIEGDLFGAYDELYWKERAAYPSFRADADEPTREKVPSVTFDALKRESADRLRRLPADTLIRLHGLTGARADAPMTVPLDPCPVGLLSY